MPQSQSEHAEGNTSWLKRKLKSLQAVFVGDEYSDDVPLKTMRRKRERESAATEMQDENEKHL